VEVEFIKFLYMYLLFVSFFFNNYLVYFALLFIKPKGVFVFFSLIQCYFCCVRPKSMLYFLSVYFVVVNIIAIFKNLALCIETRS